MIRIKYNHLIKKMEFCEICSNMIYIKSSECPAKYGNDKDKEINAYNPKLIKYCRHCGFEKEEETSKPIKVSEMVYTDDDLFYNQYNNKYLRYDPSLRRIKDNEIKCVKCDIPDNERIIIPIKYHPTQMKYLYVCDNCGNIFKDEKKSS